jgi:hypothetical protein
MLYPKETVFLLRGKRDERHIDNSEVIVLPLATHGQGFATIPTHMLPIDFSIVRTVHPTLQEA